MAKAWCVLSAQAGIRNIAGMAEAGHEAHLAQITRLVVVSQAMDV